MIGVESAADVASKSLRVNSSQSDCEKSVQHWKRWSRTSKARYYCGKLLGGKEGIPSMGNNKAPRQMHWYLVKRPHPAVQARRDHANNDPPMRLPQCCSSQSSLVSRLQWPEAGKIDSHKSDEASSTPCQLIPRVHVLCESVKSLSRNMQ